MPVPGITGHYIDGKYRIDRELGRGGMGTVYLATHLGTERPVAVKVISPEYMLFPLQTSRLSPPQGRRKGTQIKAFVFALMGKISLIPAMRRRICGHG